MFNLNKHILSVNLPLIILFLFTSTVNAGILDGCFGTPGYKPISAEKLKAKADISANYKGVCYDSSICLARAEGAINKQQESYLLGTINHDPSVGYNYSEKFNSLLEINDTANAKSSLNINEITESGFIHLNHTSRDRIVHTAYIQVTRNGEKYFYNNNFIDIDGVFTKGDTTEITRAGASQRYLLNADKVAKLNSWLEESGHKIYYTPTRSVSENITSAMSAARP